MPKLSQKLRDERRTGLIRKHAEKRAELRKLKEVEIPANRRAIQVARELGDVRFCTIGQLLARSGV